MKNLIKLVTKEEKQRLEDFIFEINKVESLEGLKGWEYTTLIPRGKNLSNFTLNSLRAYHIGRKEKAIYKEIERQVNRINFVANAGNLVSVKITVEWKRNRTWGANPTAEAWCIFIDKDGNQNSHYAKSGSIGGCGYDKGSTAVAECLNQFNEVLKLLYTEKEKNVTAENHEILGYGSGYGILPAIEGGVGVSCYPTIFKNLGFEFKTTASGKSFNTYSIERIK